MPPLLCSRAPLRAGYALLAAALVALIVVQYVRQDVGWWPTVAFGLGPDVALLLGAGSGLERGQLHPRAVALYNLLHRFWGPAALAAVALAASLSPAWLVGALAWGTHVAVDRAVGYGLRTPEGFQRAG
ncbi:MAG TPA: DUF4260 family protein [Gaiellaceae bacterium]|nr:DUF4260 family protein [Gaiellaceae bacterium]